MRFLGKGPVQVPHVFMAQIENYLKVILYNILKNFLRNLLARVFQRGIVSVLKTVQIFECSGFGGGVFNLWE